LLVAAPVGASKSLFLGRADPGPQSVKGTVVAAIVWERTHGLARRKIDGPLVAGIGTPRNESNHPDRNDAP